MGGPVREHLVPIETLRFSTSGSSLDDAARERVRHAFEVFRDEPLARLVVLRAPARGSVEGALVEARLRATRAELERAEVPAAMIEEAVVPVSETAAADTLGVFLLCPVTYPVP